MHCISSLSFALLLAGATTVSAQGRVWNPAPVPEGNTFYGARSFAELGQSQNQDSTHYKVYNASAANAASALNTLESVYECFIGDLGYRDGGVSIRDDPNAGPWWKTNVFSSPTPGVAGYVTQDSRTGLGYIVMSVDYITDVNILAHELTHVVAFGYNRFSGSAFASGWQESIANFGSELFRTSTFCAAQRTKYKIPDGWTLFDPRFLLSNSHLTLIDAGGDNGQVNNQYQAWPFLHYLTMNIDKYPGMGRDTIRNMLSTYDGKETPFHTLQRMTGGAKPKVQNMAARYWARMAYADFKNTNWYTQFYGFAKDINYNNLDRVGDGEWRVKPEMRPRYLGANIIPLNVTGVRFQTIRVTGTTAFTATLTILGANRSNPTVRYINVKNVRPGVKEVRFRLRKGEDATLVVVNTPVKLLDYDARSTSTGAVSRGLDYRVQFIGGNVTPRLKTWVP